MLSTLPIQVPPTNERVAADETALLDEEALTRCYQPCRFKFHQRTRGSHPLSPTRELCERVCSEGVCRRPRCDVLPTLIRKTDGLALEPRRGRRGAKRLGRRKEPCGVARTERSEQGFLGRPRPRPRGSRTCSVRARVTSLTRWSTRSGTGYLPIVYHLEGSHPRSRRAQPCCEARLGGEGTAGEHDDLEVEGEHRPSAAR